MFVTLNEEIGGARACPFRQFFWGGRVPFIVCTLFEAKLHARPGCQLQAVTKQSLLSKEPLNRMNEL